MAFPPKQQNILCHTHKHTWPRVTHNYIRCVGSRLSRAWPGACTSSVSGLAPHLLLLNPTCQPPCTGPPFPSVPSHPPSAQQIPAQQQPARWADAARPSGLPLWDLSSQGLPVYASVRVSPGPPVNRTLAPRGQDCSCLSPPCWVHGGASGNLLAK